MSRETVRRFAIQLTMVVATFISSATSLMADSATEAQARCELSAIRDTRSAFAVQSIRSACNWLALNGDSLLNERSKGYYVCLVRELSGVHGNQAAEAIVSACRRTNPF